MYKKQAFVQLMMAESSSEVAAASTEVLIQHSKEEPTFGTETCKELLVPMTTEMDLTGTIVGIEVRGSSDSPPDKEGKATSPDPWSLTRETGMITTEEESGSDVLGHIKTGGGQEQDPGKPRPGFTRKAG